MRGRKDQQRRYQTKRLVSKNLAYVSRAEHFELHQPASAALDPASSRLEYEDGLHAKDFCGLEGVSMPADLPRLRLRLPWLCVMRAHLNQSPRCCNLLEPLIWPHSLDPLDLDVCVLLQEATK